MRLSPPDYSAKEDGEEGACVRFKDCSLHPVRAPAILGCHCCTGALLACLSVYHCGPGAHRDQNELQLETVVNHWVGAAIKPGPSARAVYALNC